MLHRCSDPDRAKYYGDVHVCERWLTSYFNFLEDMGVRPDGTTLDRRDNEQGYSKENCRWRTPKEQAHNRRNNVTLTLNGITKAVTAWAEELKVSDQTLFHRKRAGWSDVDILTKPLQRKFAGNQWTP